MAPVWEAGGTGFGVSASSGKLVAPVSEIGGTSFGWLSTSCVFSAAVLVSICFAGFVCPILVPRVREHLLPRDLGK